MYNYCSGPERIRCSFSVFQNLLGGVVVRRSIDAVGREKFVHREGDAAEHRAGIVLDAGLAFFVGQAVIVYRQDELAVPLQPEDGELPQRAGEDPAAVREDQLLPEVVEDEPGDGAGLRARRGHGVRELHVQQDGVHALRHSHGLGAAVGEAAVGGVHLGGALAAEQHDPLVEDGEAPHGVLAGEGDARHVVEVGDVYGVIPPVEADLIHLHVGKQKRRRAGAHAEGAVCRCQVRTKTSLFDQGEIKTNQAIASFFMEELSLALRMFHNNGLRERCWMTVAFSRLIIRRYLFVCQEWLQ